MAVTAFTPWSLQAANRVQTAEDDIFQAAADGNRPPPQGNNGRAGGPNRPPQPIN